MASEPGRPSFERLNEIFDAVAARPPQERERALDDLCAGDDALRDKITRLLAAYEESGSLLDTSSADRLVEALPEIPTHDLDASLVGLRIGRYETVAVLASGGMGTVYEANQENPRRRIALKVLKGETTTEAATRRFEQEAQILALLRHPGIAQIYETGVHAEGDVELPYFAMELVHGRQLDEYCRDLARRAVLETFARVCDAVQHAHQKGVIHRDIKPANILVESGGRPKILDFGISSSRLAWLESGESLPDVGRVTGTLPYMSPEQTRGDWTELDIRCDVYSLGVVLYQLLTRRLPFDPAGRSPLEFLRIIREGTPSRLDAVDRTLRGDLEAIVHKAIARDRAVRYASAGELANDLRRHLDAEPVLARGASSAYRTWKLASRNRATLALSVVLLVLATSVVVQSILLTQRGEQEADTTGRAAVVTPRDEASARGDAEAVRYRLGIAEARAALLENRLIDARAHLESLPESQRGWAWRYLFAELDRSIATPISGLPNAWGLAISADGRYLAGSDDAGGLVVFDTEEQRDVLRQPNAHTGELRTLAFGRNDELVSGSRRDAVAKLWSATAGRLLGTVEGHALGISGVAYSSDGEWIATASLDRTARVWRRENLDEAASVLRHPRAVWSIAFVPDGLRVVTSCRDNRARIWNIETGEAEAAFAVMPTNRRADSSHAWSIAVSRDGSRIATTSHAGDVKLWDVETRSLVHVLRGHSGRVHSVTFSDGGERLASGGVDGVIRVWSVVDGGEHGQLRGHPLPAHTVRFFPGDDERLASSSTDGSIKVWSLPRGAGPRKLSMHRGELARVVAHPDGKRVITAGGAGEILTWNAATSEIIARIDGAAPGVVSIAIDSSGARLGAASRGQPVRIWNVDTGEVERDIRAAANSAWSIAFRPSRPHLASAWSDGMVRHHDVDSGNETAAFRAHDQAARAVAFSPDGSLLATASANGEVKIWDAESHAFLRRPSGGLSLVWKLRFSPDGEVLAAARSGGVVEIWDVATGASRQVLRGHASQVFSVDFSADGSRLVSASQDRRPRIWNWRRGETLLALDDVSGWCWDAAFSHDGERVIAVSTDKNVHVWDAAR